MKILITGGCGYIGSALYNYLYDKHTLTSVDLELYGNPGIANRKMDYSSKELDVTEYDVVVHLASHSSVGICKKDRYGMLENNVINFLKLTSRLKSTQKFIYASSSCVYDSFRKATEADFLNPTDDLSMSKSIIDGYMRIDRNIQFYGLRFGGVNGWSPNLRTDLMINSMVKSAKTHSEIHVSNSHAERPILGMWDLCRAVESIINSKEDNPGIFNLHSFDTTVGEAAEFVSKRFGVQIKTNYSKPKTFSFSMSSDKFREEFKWEPMDTMETIVGSLFSFPMIEGNRL